MSGKRKRPLLRYFGGKWRLAPHIMKHLPPHRHYIEPFGGAASVLLRKPRVYNEVYNDLDSDVVNLFRILRDETAAEKLIRSLTLTPYSREELETARQPCDDPIEKARRLIVRSFMGFGANSIHNHQTGFRSGFRSHSTSGAGDWRNYPEALYAVVDRLRGVTIENDEALTVIARYDHPAALHYVDPPYVHDTRNNTRGYRFEMSDQQHCELASVLNDISGMVVLSGYHGSLYDELYADWHVVEIDTHADGASKRTEVLWLNAAAKTAVAKMKQDDQPALLRLMEKNKGKGPLI